MIEWGSLKQLHAIKKLNTILSRWYELDLLFCDQNAHPKAHDNFDNRFLKMYLEQPGALENFPLEIKEKLGKFKDESSLELNFNLGAPHVFGMAKKVIFNNELSGFIL